MDTSNHSSRHHRIYWLTSPGQRLAAYLDFTDTRLPAADQDIQFADVPPEHHDVDRPETELERLHRQLEEQLERMREAGSDDEVFISARDNVKEIRAKIYDLENATPEDDDDDEGGTVRIYDDDLDHYDDDGGYDDSEDDDWEEE